MCLQLSVTFPTRASYPEERSGYFEGDIVLDPMQRNGLRNEKYRWPKGEVVYQFNGTFTEAQEKLIRNVFEYYKQFTCIKFRPKTEQDVDFVSIQNDQFGCYSSVGMRKNKQVLMLGGDECFEKKGTIIHEFMHAIGFYHEQARTDRDDYVTIMWNDVPGWAVTNFQKYDQGVIAYFGQSYDYGSVMHYSSYAFSLDGYPTIVPKVCVLFYNVYPVPPNRTKVALPNIYINNLFIKLYT